MPGFQWIITQSGGSSGGSSGASTRSARKGSNPLGFGALRPFRITAGGDVVTGSDEELIDSNVGQILGTEQGEVPWRPSFGVKLQQLRHRINSQALAEIGRISIANALARWEPRAQVLSCKTLSPMLVTGEDLQLELFYRIAAGAARTQRLTL